MRKKFSALTPEEILDIKKDYIWQKDTRADQSHAAEEVSDAQAEALYNNPDYPTRTEVIHAMLVAHKEYPYGVPLTGKFFDMPDGTRIYKFVPKNKNKKM